MWRAVGLGFHCYLLAADHREKECRRNDRLYPADFSVASHDGELMMLSFLTALSPSRIGLAIAGVALLGAVATISYQRMSLQALEARLKAADELTLRTTVERDRAVSVAGENARKVSEALRERDNLATALEAMRTASQEREVVVREVVKEIHSAPPPTCDAYPGLVAADRGLRNLVSRANADGSKR